MVVNIPFLNKYINSIVKRQKVADTVDYLNYYVTSIMLTSFSIAISAKQYFGSPIQCWVPSEYKGGWEKYTEDYCFIANSYFVPFNDSIPGDIGEREDKITYYRWVPIVLALQAFAFFLPNWLWNMLHKQTAANPRSFLSEAEKVKHMMGSDRDKEIASLAEYFMETVSVFGSRSFKKRRASPRSGYNAMFLYLLTKTMYVLNVCGQLWMLNHFLGGNYFNWGWHMATKVMHGQEWEESPIFPRVIMCDFTVRKMGNLHRNTVQCVIMMNMINEKLYLFLYFWFLFIALVTVINFVYYVVMMLVPFMRVRLVMRNYDSDSKSRVPAREVRRFVAECLHPDGVLLLQFVKEHVGGRVAHELTNKLLALYTHDVSSPRQGTYRSFSESSDDKHPSSPSDEKRLLSRPPHNHYGQYTAPPTMEQFYPNLTRTPNAPSIEDYTDHGTMRVGGPEEGGLTRRSTPTDV